MEITPEITQAAERYVKKYGDSINWEILLQNVRKFVEDRNYYLTFERANWFGFLLFLSNIEKTIGLFGYSSKGTFHRIFTMFGRAYLEELAVIVSDKGKSMGMEWIHPNTSKTFHAGDGKPGDIDLKDRNGITYDVKNDQIDFDKAHDADYLLKYRSLDGYVELHKRPTEEGQGSFIEIFAECPPLAYLAEVYGLDQLLFNKRSSEEDIERYLGLID